ncbi:3-dehydroquinate synthase [bacterium]|nr:3-dehydroquinate synthase [bacterium]
MPRKIHIDLGSRSYNIFIKNNILAEASSYLTNLGLGKKCAVITNEVVKQWYLKPLINNLTENGFEVSSIILPDGEKTKSITYLETLYHEMLKSHFDRNSFVVALGGGVVGDLAGFAASSYMRGIPFVQIPTTLLSQVDSSVGGKTGINLKEGKNLVGAFYQPKIVLIDPLVLKTLEIRQLKAGFAEVIKYAVIHGKTFFDYLVNNLYDILALEEKSLSHIIAVSCEIKAYVVEQDERESGLRAILNFGHTVGHAIEALTDYDSFVHGEAISVGMAAACRLAEQKTGFSKKDTARVKNLIIKSGLPVDIPEQLSADKIIEYMKHDKKVKDGKIRFILPDKIGNARIVNNVTEDDMKRAISLCRS